MNHHLAFPDVEWGVIQNEAQSLPGHPHAPTRVRKAGWDHQGDNSGSYSGGGLWRWSRGTVSGGDVFLAVEREGLVQGYIARQKGAKFEARILGAPGSALSTASVLDPPESKTLTAALLSTNVY